MDNSLVCRAVNIQYHRIGYRGLKLLVYTNHLQESELSGIEIRELTFAISVLSNKTSKSICLRSEPPLGDN